MDFKLTLCLCNILNTTTLLHWALCPYYDQALWSCQAIFPLRTSGACTLCMAEAAARDSCPFLSCWILPFCTQIRGKTYKLLDQRKLNSSVTESGKGLLCPSCPFCPPWMQKVSYLVLWVKSQNFSKLWLSSCQHSSSLILLPVQTISRDGAIEKVNDCDGNWGRRVSRKSGDWIQMMTRTSHDHSLLRHSQQDQSVHSCRTGAAEPQHAGSYWQFLLSKWETQVNS